jgi:hypothetical protein
MTDEEPNEIQSEFERLKEKVAPLIADGLAAVRAERESRRLRSKQGAARLHG